MIVAADSSVLIASLVGNDPSHEAGITVLEEHRPLIIPAVACAASFSK